MSTDDAVAIVGAWGAFGSEALGRLAGVEPEVAAKKLLGASEREARIKGGSLLGALLYVRYGDDLKEHLKSLLRRLVDRPILGGGNLLTAFSYIALMHSEGLTFLSRAVLAEALGVPLGRLNPLVLNPLGLEAATSSDGHYILTRHRSIARAVVSLLEDLFDDDVEGMYIDLIASVARLRSNGERVIELSRWHYGISSHFANKGRHDVAIRIAQSALKENPSYLPLMVHLSRLYRETNSQGSATMLFREYDKRVRGRAAFMEWAVAEGLVGHSAIGALLAALALSDKGGEYPLDLETAPKVLNVLAENFVKLYEQYAEMAFLEAMGSAIQLGRVLNPVDKIRQEIEVRLRKVAEGKPVPDDNMLSSSEKVKGLCNAITVAWSYTGLDEPIAREYIGSAQKLEFSGLLRLLQNLEAAKPEQVPS